MSRIGTFGASQLYLYRLNASQERLNTLQQQVATEKKASAYTGIASDANRLINFENEMAAASQFKKNNDMASTRLQATQTSLNAVQDTIKKFRDMLDNYARGNTKDGNQIKDIQEWAVRSMSDMESYLNTNVDGQYLFSGGRVSTAPVQLKTTNLKDFQALYDGFLKTYPTTRDANLQDMALTNKETGSVSFSPTTGALIPANAGAFANVAAGSTVTVGGTASNNGVVTVTGHLATNVAGVPLAETANAGNSAYITFSGTDLNHATTGNLAFAFDAAGDMTITPGTANTLSGLTVGSKFTIKNSTGGNYDGAYVVTANANGKITVANDTSAMANETVNASALTLRSDALNDGTFETSTSLAAVTGDAKFQISGNTVTMTVPSTAPNLSGLFTVGGTISIAGTSNHNGSFNVASVTANTVTFNVNVDALRTSQFVPQTGRTDVNLSIPGRTDPLVAGNYGSLSFSPTGTGGETITAASAGTFLDQTGAPYPAVGSLFTLSSTSGVNDGVYKVVSNNGTSIVVQSNTLTAESSATATFNSTSWYKGDTSNLKQRIDDQTSIDVSMYASDPGFEKAFRAMGLIAQGVTGTAGGLDQNQDRIAAARFLISDALEAPAAGTPPYGAEDRGDMETLQSKVGVNQAVIKVRNEKHAQFMGLFQARADELENVDKTTAVASLLDEKTALEASYQTLATVRGLSLLNYMK
jgi:flagellin-like hook-associated protein FlgL